MNTTSVPKEAISIYNKALNLSHKGKYEKALEQYNQALSMHPGFIEAHNNIGEIYSQQGDSEKAIAAYMDALSISRHYRVLLNLGVEHFNTGNFETAISLFTESLKQKPDFLEANFYTGLINYNKKNMAKAEKFLTKVIEQDHKHLKANYLLSHIYYGLQQFDKVVKCLDIIKDRVEDKVFLNKYYGFCYYHLGRYEESIDFLTATLEALPKYTEFKDYLTSLTYENKVDSIEDIDKEIKGLEKRVKKDNRKINEVTKLSMLYIFKGENNKAEKLLLSERERLAS